MLPNHIRISIHNNFPPKYGMWSNEQYLHEKKKKKKKLDIQANNLSKLTSNNTNSNTKEL